MLPTFFFPLEAQMFHSAKVSVKFVGRPLTAGGHHHNCTNCWLTQQLPTSFSFFNAVFHCSSVAPSFKHPVNFWCPKHFFLTLTLSLYLSIWLQSNFRSHLDPSSSFALLLKGALSGHFLSLKWNLSPVLVLATQADKNRFKNVWKKEETEQSVACSLRFLPAL